MKRKHILTLLGITITAGMLNACIFDDPVCVYGPAPDPSVYDEPVEVYGPPIDELEDEDIIDDEDVDETEDETQSDDTQSEDPSAFDPAEEEPTIVYGPETE